MITSYIPTLESPNENSPTWYKNFHSSFYLSQLVNNVLLSYMDNFIEIISLEKIIIENREELEANGGISIVDGERKIDRDKVYSVDVEIALNELIERFKQQAVEINNTLTCMGVNSNGYMERTVNVDLSILKNSVGTNNWHHIVKGFLNVWEFLFLFSIAESALKTSLDNFNANTSDLIAIVTKKKANATVISNMKEKHNIDRRFMLDIWSLYDDLRNIYSHTHGVLSDDNKEKFKEYISKFKSSFDKAFHSKDSPEMLILDTLMVGSSEIFKDEFLVVDNFYLIGDQELNIFRNVITEFMTELAT